MGLTTLDTPCACGVTSYQHLYAATYKRGFPTYYRFALLKCRNCGLVRSAPVPDQAMYYALDFDKATGSPVARKRPWLVAAAEGITQALRRAGFAGGTILDVGCNTGELVGALIQNGYAAEGCDIDEAAIEVGRERGLPVFTHNLERERLSRQYSAAVCIHTLEHTLAPAALLDHLGEALKDGAPLYIAVPNLGGLIPRLMKENWGFLVPAQHVWHFTPTTLRSTVERTGKFRLFESTQRVHLEPMGLGLQSAAKRIVAWAACLANSSDEIRATLLRASSDA